LTGTATAHRVLIAAREHDYISARHRCQRMPQALHLALAIDEDVKEDDAFRFGHHRGRQHVGNG
jgi:hypothetical protein